MAKGAITTLGAGLWIDKDRGTVKGKIRQVIGRRAIALDEAVLRPPPMQTVIAFYAADRHRIATIPIARPSLVPHAKQTTISQHRTIDRRTAIINIAISDKNRLGQHFRLAHNRFDALRQTADLFVSLAGDLHWHSFHY
jgi:hypothetical protein